MTGMAILRLALRVATACLFLCGIGVAVRILVECYRELRHPNKDKS